MIRVLHMGLCKSFARRCVFFHKEPPDMFVCSSWRNKRASNSCQGRSGLEGCRALKDVEGQGVLDMVDDEKPCMTHN